MRGVTQSDISIALIESSIARSVSRRPSYASGNGSRWIRARERRKPSGSPTVTNINEAMSTGRLPEHASADQWVPELSGIIRQEQWSAWVGAALFGLSAAMGVFLVFDKPEHPWLGLLAVAEASD